MTERISIRLVNAQQGHAALMALWPKLKALLMAEHRLSLEVKPETRSSAQNRLLHSSLQDVARQVEWMGRKWDTDTWKRLCTASWMRARGDALTILPALDGNGVDVVVTRTSKLSRAECSELTEWIHAWGSEQGVMWSPASVAMDAEEFA